MRTEVGSKRQSRAAAERLRLGREERRETAVWGGREGVQQVEDAVVVSGDVTGKGWVWRRVLTTSNGVTGSRKYQQGVWWEGQEGRGRDRGEGDEG